MEDLKRKQSMMAVKISSLLIFAVLVGCDAAQNADEAVNRELDKLAQIGNLAGESAIAISDQVKREGRSSNGRRLRKPAQPRDWSSTMP